MRHGQDIFTIHTGVTTTSRRALYEPRSLPGPSQGLLECFSLRESFRTPPRAFWRASPGENPSRTLAGPSGRLLGYHYAYLPRGLSNSQKGFHTNTPSCSSRLFSTPSQASIPKELLVKLSASPVQVFKGTEESTSRRTLKRVRNQMTTFSFQSSSSSSSEEYWFSPGSRSR